MTGRMTFRMPVLGKLRGSVKYPPIKTICWLGREDSNLRMAESKSAALPLGYAPAGRLACAAAARGTIAAANWPINGSKGGAGVSR